jgi:Skp family chaperone for outer membrane proteins
MLTGQKEYTMKKHVILSLVATAILAGSSFSAFAQDAGTAVAGHPRVNEVDQRLQNQQNRIDAGVKDGQINAKQEMRDEKRGTRVSQQLSKDEAKHNGHITKHEQKKLNKELDKNSKHIQKQKEEKPATVQ